MKIRGIRSFCKENGIELLILFGSSVREKSEDARDVDIAIKLIQKARISKLKLIYKLDDFLDGENIDLVLLTSETDPLLLHEIFSNGKCMYERKKGIFEKEKLRAWKLYLDTEKIRNMRRRYLKNFVKKVSHVA
jgi:predicted nucleotidyltransferase